MENKESLLEYAKKLKEKREEKEEQLKKTKNEIKKNIEKTPYLKETYFLSKLISNRFRQLLEGLKATPTFDLDTIYRKADVTLKSYYPILRLDFYSNGEKKDLKHCSKLYINYKENSFYIYIEVTEMNEGYLFKESFKFNKDDILTIYNDFKSEYSIFKIEFDNNVWEPIALDKIINKYRNNKDNNSIDRILEICDALLELFKEKEFWLLSPIKD